MYAQFLLSLVISAYRCLCSICTYLLGNNLLLYHFQVSLVKVISFHVWYTYYIWGGGDSYKIYVKPVMHYQLSDLGSLF